MSAGNEKGVRVHYRKSGGFTYIAVLIFVAINAAVLAATGMLFSDSARREKERELLFVGNQYRQAINAYQKQFGGFPAKLEDLVEKKHLRRLYRDPLTNSSDWGLVPAPDKGVIKGGIMGVYSQADGPPFKTANFLERDKEFAGAGSYAEWRFIATP
jgi:type II secretory pathway pseudopilin PulG